MMRQTAILDMFARSPIRPLQQHMQKAHACVELLLPFYNAVQAGDWDKAITIRAEINDLEHAADDLKKEMRLHLPKGLFLPVPRADLLDILSQQELMANTCKDIAGIILGRKMHFPDSMVEGFTKFLQRSLDAAGQAKKAISELDELLETGFRGKEATVVEEMIRELGEIEEETDRMQVAVRQALFDIEKTLEPIDVMFLYKVIKKVGSVADYAEKTGTRLEMLLASS
jgi:predicted phosphate transport protein (TIGR00153 family)